MGSEGVRAESPPGHERGVPTLRIAQDDAADELLGRDPLALVIGMLLDQLRRSPGNSHSQARGTAGFHAA
jgi:hypothetical protein